MVRRKTTPALIVRDFAESDKKILRLPKGIIAQSYRLAAKKFGVKLLKEAETGGNYYLGRV